MKYIIDFKQDVTQEQIDQYIADANGTVIKTWDHFNNVIEIEVDQAPPQTDIVDFVVQDDQPVIKPLELDIQFNPYLAREDDPTKPQITFSTSDDQDWWKNAVLKEPEFDEPEKTIARKGQGIQVYIMDSGINADHPEFANTNIENVYSIIPNDFSDPHGHGTAIASVIAGENCGITAANLKIVKIFGRPEGTYISEILDALNAIQENHTTNTWAVINCSWFIEKNTWVENKMKQMVANGFFIVASAGNTGQPVSDVTPAAMSEVYTVGSFGPDLVPSDFSAYTGGSEISYTSEETNSGKLDLWAPGEKIWAAKAAGGYGNTAGTSMSAAITTAVFAYSLSDFLNDQGEKNYHVNLSIHNTPELRNGHFITAHNGLLDLSDPKYANSTDRIVAMRNFNGAQQTTTLTDSVFWVLRGANPTEKNNFHEGPKVIDIYNTASVEEVIPLPDGKFGIGVNGNITAADLSESDFPQDGSSHNKITGRIKVTDHQGLEEFRDITILMVNPDYDYNTDPGIGGNDLVRIQLNFNCTGGVDTSNFCAFNEPTFGCFDDCGGLRPTCCDPQGKAEQDCYCI